MPTYDVAAFQVTGNPHAALPQELWDPSGEGQRITGILKLCQRFLLELLTVQGSMPFATSRGTELLAFARQGRLRNEVDANILFQYAVSQAQTNLQADQLSTDDLDEQFGSVTVNSVAFTPGFVQYSFQLRSKAGTARSLTLPVAA